jgi:PII-like signaling protein
VSDDALKLTAYFGERARADGGFLADALVEAFARHRLQSSVVLRGIEGFGARHARRTDRLLSLSEDLPLVAVAVDERPRVEAALADVRALPRFTGRVTLEPARLLAGAAGLGAGAQLPVPSGTAQLTLYLGRHERVQGRAAHEAVVALLHRHEIAGATVLLGVDGTAHGVRQRARLTRGNAAVPLMVVAVGDGARLAAVLPALGALLPRGVATLERVGLCKRDGVALAAPPALADHDASGRDVWQKVMVFASEQSRHAGRPLHRTLVRELHGAGAAGATTLRGIRGYHGAHAPHGDTLWQLRRRVPVVTTIVDRPSRMREWFPVVDRVTDQTGLVTASHELR